MTVEKDGEKYYTAAEAAEYLGISRPTFNKNVKPNLPEYKHGALRRIVYRQSDLDKFKGIHPVEANHQERS